MEREIQHVERDLGQLQEQREYVLNRHEELLEAHERLLQGYHRLVAEHSRMIAERDLARSQLAARDAAAAPQSYVPAGTTREQSTLVAAAVGSQSSGARGGRAPSGQGMAPASGAVAGSVGERGRDLPAEAARAAIRSTPVASAGHRPAREEQASQLRSAGYAGAAPPTVGPPARLLGALRARLRDNTTKSAAHMAERSAALQGIFMVKVAQLKQLRLPGSLSIGPTGDAPEDQPDSDDPA